MLVLAEIASFALDAERNTPVIILKESGGERTLAVPIGPLEASAIAVESLEMVPEKPMTIDLVAIILEKLGAKLSRVVIYDLLERSLMARMQIDSGSGILLVDCRPCDAIALALRCSVDILVEEQVLDRVSGGTRSIKEQLRQRIRSIDTVEFGKYILE